VFCSFPETSTAHIRKLTITFIRLQADHEYSEHQESDARMKIQFSRSLFAEKCISQQDQGNDCKE